MSYLNNAANRRRRGATDHICMVGLLMWSLGRSGG